MLGQVVLLEEPLRRRSAAPLGRSHVHLGGAVGSTTCTTVGQTSRPSCCSWFALHLIAMLDPVAARAWEPLHVLSCMCSFNGSTVCWDITHSDPWPHLPVVVLLRCAFVVCVCACSGAWLRCAAWLRGVVCGLRCVGCSSCFYLSPHPFCSDPPTFQTMRTALEAAEH